jgi:3'-phosphoadenosine 5'-phosphosulfate sulfotransferase (PAPS reductase)/FAD synthetase
MIEATLQILTEVFAQHDAAVLWVSGGKDSLTLTHLCQPWKDRIVLLHNAVDTGFAGVWENLSACATDWGYPYLLRTEPRMTFEAYVAQYGWPVEVVPTSMDGVIPTPYQGEHRVSSWWFCTTQRQLLPLIQRTQAMGATAILTGSRGSDAPLFATGGPVVDGRDQYGWMRYNPLHAWPTEAIWTYVDAEAIPLPLHYAWKRDATFEWPDCRMCTWQPQYLAWLEAQRPDEYAALMASYGPTSVALQEAIQAAQPLVHVPEDGAC